MRRSSVFHAARRASAALVVCVVAQGAAAQETDVSILAATCTNCHGPDGRSSGTIPTIGGWPFAVLKAQLDAFKADEVRDATLMPRLVRGYRDDELEALARYFSDIEQ